MTRMSAGQARCFATPPLARRGPSERAGKGLPTGTVRCGMLWYGTPSVEHSAHALRQTRTCKRATVWGIKEPGLGNHSDLHPEVLRACKSLV